MTHFELLKYAATGIASPGMTAYDKMRALAMAGGGSIKTLTGVPPLSFRANGNPLVSWSMSGNSQQNGTPAPDAPIMPELVGEKTRNLFDVNNYYNNVTPKSNCYITFSNNSINIVATGNDPYIGIALKAGLTVTDAQMKYAIKVDPNTDYSLILSTAYNIYISFLKNNGDAINKNYQLFTTPLVTFTTPTNCEYLMIRFGGVAGRTISYSNTMLLIGTFTDQTIPDYIPYGYKIPITCAGQTQNVYLGEVQTVRRIKKLVLTGLETVYENQSGDNKYFSIANSDSKITGVENCVCSHFVATTVYTATTNTGFLVSSNDIRFRPADVSTMSADHFKTFLQQQYQNGTPVTVWYVLAEPKTAIVNEPLCKIGDYADTLDSADAGITIPTVKGGNTLTVDTELQPSEMTITYRE